MSVSRWDPLREMVSLREAMDRLLEESWVRGPASMLSRAASFTVDLYETANEVVIEATLPGVEPDDLDISIVGDTLTIKADVKAGPEAPDRNYLIRERRPASATRVISIPQSVMADQAVATFKNGVLFLTLPKAEEVKPKTIKVEAR
jgi:HSP20 family protein